MSSGIYLIPAIMFLAIALYLAFRLRGSRRLLTAMILKSRQHEDALAEAFETRERHLLEHFTQFMSIFEAMNALIYVADMQTGELLFINAFGKKLFGEHTLGRPCYESLQKGQTKRCDFCTNDRLVRNGVAQPPVAWEFCNTLTGRWFLCIDRAIPWSDGRLVRMEIAVDITDRKHAEKFREEYISLISHDLRNPLTVISSAVEYLQERHAGETSRGAPRALAIIAQNSQRMNTMIDDLLDTAIFESGTFRIETECVDFGQLLADTVTGTCPATELGRIRLTIAPRLPNINIDIRRIERVIANLLSNAIKYATKLSPIVVDLGQHDGFLRLSVTNDGAGITAEHMPNLFQKYYRAGAKSAHGTGVGLYATRLIIEAHGGQAWATSTPGETTSFYVDLPVCCAP